MSSQISIAHFLQDKDWNVELLNRDEEIISEDIVLSGINCGTILAVKKKIRLLPYNYLRITFGPCIDYNSPTIIIFRVFGFFI